MVHKAVPDPKRSGAAATRHCSRSFSVASGRFVDDAPLEQFRQEHLCSSRGGEGSDTDPGADDEDEREDESDEENAFDGDGDGDDEA